MGILQNMTSGYCKSLLSCLKDNLALFFPSFSIFLSTYVFTLHRLGQDNCSQENKPIICISQHSGSEGIKDQCQCMKSRNQLRHLKINNLNFHIFWRCQILQNSGEEAVHNSLQKKSFRTFRSETHRDLNP